LYPPLFWLVTHQHHPRELEGGFDGQNRLH
jgi:hypothetical protein